jgi:hypothetical protein
LARLLDLLPDLARRFTEDDYSLDQHSAIGLLQHYGLPTWMVDFTSHLEYAFAFAAAGSSTVGRVAVMPLSAFPKTDGLVNLSDHRWAERPRRQAAFGLIMTNQGADLKSDAARTDLNIVWYEFPVIPEDREFLLGKHEDLTRLSDDPSAGFLRFHITEYVEARGKLSPALTDWLLERIPIAPRCFVVNEFEAANAVVHFRPVNVLPSFDEAEETEHSRTYWSSAFDDSSWDRMRSWEWPPVGSTIADPRTYHARQSSPLNVTARGARRRSCRLRLS